MHEIDDSGAKFDGPRIGIIGGGQLAKMTALAAYQLGCGVSILEKNPLSPALKLTSSARIGDWDDPRVLLDFSASVDVLTIENEFVSHAALESVSAAGCPVFPSPRTLNLIQDKLIQKATLSDGGIPVTPFREVASAEDVFNASCDWGWPILLKTRRFGYDGKGNVTVGQREAIEPGWRQLGSNEIYIEKFCPFIAELAVIVTRSRNGEMVSYPVVQTFQKEHICHETHAPANIPEKLRVQAERMAKRAIELIEGVGTFGVELFLLPDESLVLNEVAPRVHNSGHYTVEACACSQFENHVRAILGWPLGSTALRAPAVMVNILGTKAGSGEPRGIAEALQFTGVHLHIYGKSKSGRGRKMGHVTALGTSLSDAANRARAAAQCIKF